MKLKRILKVVGLILLAAGLFAGGCAAKIAVVGIPHYDPGKVALQVASTPARVARGRHFAQLLCVQCHLDPTTRQLTGKKMDEAPPEFGAIYSRNITRDPNKGIGGWSDGELAYLLRTGIARDGRFLPIMPKLGFLSDEDLSSIIAFLRSDDPLVAAVAVDPPGVSRPSFLMKFLGTVAFKPLPYPSDPVAPPPASDKAVVGRYLVWSLDCWTCHSADFKTMNMAHPDQTPGYLGGGNTVLDMSGAPVRAANLTPDDTGLGKWSEADFIATLRSGLRPDKTPLSFPMVPMPELSDEELSAIWAYLRTVPKIANVVPRQARVLADGDPGKVLYYKYQCVSCHGTGGVGVADLRQATTHYPTDEALLGWIKDAPRLKPGTLMPRWEGIIADADYPPLVAYVKKLCTK